MKISPTTVINRNSRATTTETENTQNETKFTNPGIGIRHLQSLLMTFCVVCGFLQRVNLSVTIVAMTKLENSTVEKEENEFPVYDWNNEIRGYLHGAFFLGYLIMNFPAAYLGVYFDLKKLLFVTSLVNSLLTLITPMLIEFTYVGMNRFLLDAKELAGVGNWRALVILRIIQGSLQAFMFPTMHAISAKWVPPNERSRLVGFTLSGVSFGTTITLAGSGVLASNSKLGWPTVFYASGSIAFVWVLFWGWFGSSSPTTHGTISSDEYNYICSQLPPENAKSKKKIPWLDILTSLPVWAIIIAHTTHNWGFWLLLTQMPTFLNAVSGFDIKSDGLLSSVPYITMWILQFPVMWLADKLNKRNITSLSVSRKLWNSIGVWGGAICLVVLGYFNNNAKAAVILYVFSVGIGCCSHVGCFINHIDLAPNYAGILMGLSNAFAASGGFGAPLIVSSVVDDITSASEWRTVFYIGAGILFFGNLFFLIFGSGKTQSWNNKYPDN